MDTRTREKLRRQFGQKRQARIDAAEADYKKDMEALDRIWASLHGDEESVPETTPPVPSADWPQQHKLRVTGVRKAIRDAISELGAEFNTDAIFEKVLRAFPDVKRQTVTDALFRMSNEGEIETIIPGRGRRAATYRVPKPSREVQADEFSLAAEKTGEDLPM